MELSVLAHKVSGLRRRLIAARSRVRDKPTGDSPVDDFINFGYLEMDGWMSADAMFPIRAVAEFQNERGIGGGVAEIGVHHGQMLVYLALLSMDGQRIAGYDLFERQGENEDGSGEGDKSIVLGHLRNQGINLKRVDLVSTNSLDLKPKDVIATLGSRARLFSVDGGHTPEVTENDLNVAVGCLADEGVIILDDVFSPMWPGVSEGLAAFMAANADNDPVVPFGLVGNKTLLCRPPAHAQYLEVLDEMSVHFMTRKDRFYDSPVRILLDPG